MEAVASDGSVRMHLEIGRKNAPPKTGRYRLDYRRDRPLGLSGQV
jgi:hypothetical protein